ncbi:MAG TPA: hypothetical protein VF719_04130, partial [Abditibacteriaceae bacterium]
MLPQHLTLSFEGRHLQGARPFAVFESKDGAHHLTRIGDANLPDFSQQFANTNALEALRMVLAW